MTCRTQYLIERVSPDRIVVSAHVENKGQVVLQEPVAEVTEIDNPNPIVKFVKPLGLNGVKNVVKLIADHVQAIQESA